MKVLTLVVLALLLLLLQSSALLPRAGFFAWRPDLMLLLVIFWGLFFGPAQGLAAAAVAGLMLDALSAAPLGAHLGALVPVVVLSALTDQSLVASRFFRSLLLTLVGTGIYYLILGLLLQLHGRSVDWPGSVPGVLVPSALWNLVVSPLFYVGTHALASRLGGSSGGLVLHRETQ